MRLRRAPRRAATTVELAMIAPAVFVILLGLIVGGMGVFRYQQLAHLTREASRWAALHGADYAKDSGQPAPTAADIYNQIILPNAGAMNPSRLSYSVVWNTSNDPYRTATVGGKVVRINNIVTVSITYQWIPEAYLGGVTLGSSSSNPMAF
jgi:Flp pilus assembly protein TadG